MSVSADFGHEKGVVAGAAADIVETGMTDGLGTGPTVASLLRSLAARGLDVRCPTTSLDTARTAHHAFRGRTGTSG